MYSSPSTPGPSWYLLQTKPKQEFRALEQLENQGYCCFLPTLSVEKVRRGKRDVVVEPLFSRYLFIQLDTVTSNWFPIRSTRGVSKIVAFGERLAMLPDACIAALQHAPTIPPRPLFTPGDPVTITSGPFAGLEGIYQMTNGDERAMVLLELMSQPQKLMFAIEALRKTT
ncbi:transcription/translation regulatory transformer protein RfaH [Noviherbaspirillum malthae]|uniref:transcription/translation regulatory transformer protein RfaH n=1 Tax=Noviherbaspirillum malthae TaxID=1260987 RepID=UPI00189084B4|nr:transcription/translation regulatory transformer protein RfaH [Noviherbaspirillum malthae]